MTFSHGAVLARTASSGAGRALRRTSGRIGVRQRACQCSILAEEFWNQERPLGLASLLLPPRRPAGLLPRPIGCCTPPRYCDAIGVSCVSILRCSPPRFPACAKNAAIPRGVVAEPWRADRQGAWTGLPPVEADADIQARIRTSATPPKPYPPRWHHRGRRARRRGCRASTADDQTR